MHAYRSQLDIPPLILDAQALAKHMSFENSCSVEVGCLLRLLASHVLAGAVGEIGTGCGVGAAWIVSGLMASSRFVTIDSDAHCTHAVRELLHRAPNTRIIHGDWRDILVEGPFDLLFIDAGPAKAAPGNGETGPGGTDDILQAVQIGGMIVMDDFTPEQQWPEAWRDRSDPLRDYWLNEERLHATEILTTPTTSVILATRIT